MSRIIGSMDDLEITLLEEGQTVNYSPSQPRDSRGRFGSGGGGGGGGSPRGEQGPPQSFKDFATDEEKKELNKLAKKRLDLNKKVKDGTATQAERVEAVMVKKRIAELKDIADKRSKGVDVKPTPKPTVETPKPEVKPEVTPGVKPTVEAPTVDPPRTPVPEFKGASNIREVLANHPELNDLHTKVLGVEAIAENKAKAAYDSFLKKKKDNYDQVVSHYDQNRGGKNDRHPEGWDDDKIEAYMKESKALETEYKRLAKDWSKEIKKIGKAKEEDAKKVHAVLAIPERDRIGFFGTHKVSAHDVKGLPGKMPSQGVLRSVESKATEARKFLSTITSKKTKVGERTDVATLLKSTSEKRSWHTGNDHYGVIGLHTKVEISVAAHEYAHAIEKQMPGALTRSKAFLEARVKASGTKSISFRDKYGKGYDVDEVGNEDSFKEAFGGSVRSAEYAGKYYPDATEVLTMGVEQLYKDPKGFATKDPEYFKFVVGTLRGAF